MSYKVVPLGIAAATVTSCPLAAAVTHVLHSFGLQPSEVPPRIRAHLEIDDLTVRDLAWLADAVGLAPVEFLRTAGTVDPRLADDAGRACVMRTLSRYPRKDRS